MIFKVENKQEVKYLEILVNYIFQPRDNAVDIIANSYYRLNFDEFYVLSDERIQETNPDFYDTKTSYMEIMKSITYLYTDSLKTEEAIKYRNFEIYNSFKNEKLYTSAKEILLKYSLDILFFSSLVDELESLRIIVVNDNICSMNKDFKC